MTEHDHSHEHALDPSFPLQRRAIGLSLAVSVLMLVGKLGAWLITGSDAIFSDAAESVIHGVATGIAAVSLRISHEPADASHPYGHGKISYFSAGLEGSLIIAAAVAIYWESIGSLIVGPEVQELGLGLLITGGLGLINLGLGVYLVRTGRRHKSMILEANGKHVLTDMWTSAAVVAGVFVVWLTDIVWLDPIVAIVAASNIVWSGGKLIKRSFDGLMERADPKQTQQLVSSLEQATRAGDISGYHQLHHRQIGDVLFVDVHMLVPDGITIGDAHRRVSKVEAEIRRSLLSAELSQVRIVTHIEPQSHEDHNEGPDPLLDALPATSGDDVVDTGVDHGPSGLHVSKED